LIVKISAVLLFRLGEAVVAKKYSSSPSPDRARPRCESGGKKQRPSRRKLCRAPSHLLPLCGHRLLRRGIAAVCNTSRNVSCLPYLCSSIQLSSR